jgi:hypothetical protein
MWPKFDLYLLSFDIFDHLRRWGELDSGQKLLRGQCLDEKCDNKVT